MSKNNDENNYFKTGFTLLACIALSACGASERIAQIGKAPEVGEIVNPTTQASYQPVSLPMPAPNFITRRV